MSARMESRGLPWPLDSASHLAGRYHHQLYFLLPSPIKKSHIPLTSRSSRGRSRTYCIEWGYVIARPFWGFQVP
eukprot:1394767-Amorphochlora_amoeboformis.AAC.1